jgi:hypothetical protein
LQSLVVSSSALSSSIMFCCWCVLFVFCRLSRAPDFCCCIVLYGVYVK